MKEILESKVMIFLVLFIVGVCYLNCLDNEKEQKKASAINTNNEKINLKINN